MDVIESHADYVIQDKGEIKLLHVEESHTFDFFQGKYDFVYPCTEHMGVLREFEKLGGNRELFIQAIFQDLHNTYRRTSDYDTRYKERKNVLSAYGEKTTHYLPFKHNKNEYSYRYNSRGPVYIVHRSELKELAEHLLLSEEECWDLSEEEREEKLEKELKASNPLQIIRRYAEEEAEEAEDYYIFPNKEMVQQRMRNLV